MIKLIKEFVNFEDIKKDAILENMVIGEYISLEDDNLIEWVKKYKIKIGEVEGKSDLENILNKLDIEQKHKEVFLDNYADELSYGEIGNFTNELKNEQVEELIKFIIDKHFLSSELKLYSPATLYLRFSFVRNKAIVTNIISLMMSIYDRLIDRSYSEKNIHIALQTKYALEDEKINILLKYYKDNEEQIRKYAIEAAILETNSTTKYLLNKINNK
jgi:hypothetical protein